jgi:hypothetical protein
MISQAGDDEWMFGLNFFTNYYTVHDQLKMKVGFAPSANALPRLFELIANSDTASSATTERTGNDQDNGPYGDEEYDDFDYDYDN